MTFVEGTEVFVACDNRHDQGLEGLALSPYYLLVVWLGKMRSLGLRSKQ